MNPARSLARPLAVASAVLLTSAALPATAGAAESDMFDVSLITSTWEDGTMTFSGTLTNNTEGGSDCLIELADIDSIAAIEKDTATHLWTTDPLYDAGIIAAANVWPASGETATWSLSVPGMSEQFTPAAFVWCRADVAEGEDILFAVYPDAVKTLPSAPIPDPTPTPDPPQPGTGSPNTGSLGS